MVSTKKQAAEPCGAAAGAHLGGSIKISKQEGQSVERFTREHMDGSVSLLAGRQIVFLPPVASQLQ